MIDWVIAVDVGNVVDQISLQATGKALVDEALRSKRRRAQ